MWANPEDIRALKGWLLDIGAAFCVYLAVGILVAIFGSGSENSVTLAAVVGLVCSVGSLIHWRRRRAKR
jgi:hypothetical protein